MNRTTWLIVLVVLAFSITGLVGMTHNALGAKEYQSLAGNGFTYQGQLTQNGIPTNSTCDFRFSLWTEATNGSQVGDIQVASGIEVKEGYFSIPNLDFGNNIFTGESRWLEIEVKCTGETGYTTVTPRQSITPTPYALALPGLFTQQNDISPNVIGGYHGNLVPEDVHGATISGGGMVGKLNMVSDHFGVVGGGERNYVSGAYSVIGGGQNNLADGIGAFVGGGGTDGVNIDGNQVYGSASSIVGGLGNSIPITGVYATISGGNNNIADNVGATIGGGQHNLTQGQNATVGGGEYNTATGDYSTISGGLDARTTLFGQTAHASGSFNEDGDAQSSEYILRNVTTDATATELFLDGASERLTIPVNRTMAFEIYLVARRDAHSQSAGYLFRGVIKNDNGATSFVPSYTVFTLGEDNPAWDATLLASDLYDALIIQVSGAEDANIRWIATVHAVEVAW